jgi:hypothetical protein
MAEADHALAAIAEIPPGLQDSAMAAPSGPETIASIRERCSCAWGIKSLTIAAGPSRPARLERPALSSRQPAQNSGFARPRRTMSSIPVNAHAGRAKTRGANGTARVNTKENARKEKNQR